MTGLPGGLTMQHRKIIFAILFIATQAISTEASAIIRCELNGKSVNTSNGNETAGLTGLLRCKNEDTGKLQREQEIRNGKFMGLYRQYDADGKLVRERTVNERGNTHGNDQDFWPNGQLKREATADNGDTLGPVRSYYDNSSKQSIRFVRDRRDVLEIGYHKDGSLAQLRCPASSVMAEDRKLCGFEGKSTVPLFASNGKPSATHVWEQGRLTALTTYRDSGAVHTEMRFEEGRRVHRLFDTEGSSGKNVLREERIYEPADVFLPSTYGALQSKKLWGANEQTIEHLRYALGRLQSTERWYLNGAQRERSVVASDGSIKIEYFTDQGKLQGRESRTADGDLTGVQQIFHDNGKLSVEATFSAPVPGNRRATRMTGRKEWDASGKLIADDEILEDGSRQRRAGSAVNS